MELAVNDVSFKYNSTLSLDKISLQLYEAETLGIIGPNGSGKTTLLKCINKILTPKGGNILLNGKSVHKMSRMEIAKHIGYVPQSSNSAQALTVFEVVLMGRRPHIGWQCSDKDIEKAWEVLGLLKIEHLAMRSFNELSGGEQQRVIIALSLIHI